MNFEVGPDDDHPEIQNAGMQYDGLRFRAECKLAGTWTRPYAAMAREDRLDWLTLDEVTTAAQAFLDPVLAGGLDAV